MQNINTNERGERFDYLGSSSENNVSFLLSGSRYRTNALVPTLQPGFPSHRALALHLPTLLTVIPLDTLL